MKKDYLRSPDLLWSKAAAYFEAIAVKNEAAIQPEPYLLSGFAKSLGLTLNTLQTIFDSVKADKGFRSVINQIVLTIHVNQLEGAMINLYPEDVLNETYWAWHESNEMRIKQLENKS